MAENKKDKITISGEDYIEVVSDLIHEYFNRVISDDEIFVGLGLKDATANEFSIELSLVLSVIATRLFSIKHNNINLQGYARKLILEKNAKNIFKFNKKEEENYEDLYDQRYNMFLELIPKQKSSFEVRSQLLGFTRYLISKFSNKNEDDNKEIITKASTYIVEYGDIISRYFANSRLKVGSAWRGKYEFIITK